MNKRCDLHSHSSFSDGTLTPTQLVRLAEKQGLSALALTDHNTAGGLREFMEAGRDSSVITVPGCEFTTEWHGKEIHIVGLFFREQYWEEIEDFIELTRLAKRNSNFHMIEELNKAGYAISIEEAAALTGGEDFNRAHVARVLLNKGYVKSIGEAFDTLLKEGNGFYVPAKRLASIPTVRFIKVFNAVPIIAHPLLNLTYKELLEFIPEAQKAGLEGIETRYTEYDEEMTQTAVSLAEKFELKQSGGSDFHGGTKPGIALGSGRGDLYVPHDFYEDLLSLTEKK